ncbi:response regulator transcription factor [Herbaspirillum sp. LeCh32-8]|uniref:response regulator transcription factor n=1 Tax=Herbaspirillum sp. LeCh32-8 TaxID=2821356 RepID=UPI001AE8CFCB|nr:response regulator [Herbaspirillum sp. LeCh32-8]MBP0600739.1 response regulator transcription factor [Herbaspirillum sp. LeCh32-8]
MDSDAGSASYVNPEPLVHIIDDDVNIRDGLSELLASANLECQTYSSAMELLARPLAQRPSCLVLDVRMPGGGGLELQAQLNALGEGLPIIFMTGYGDVESCVRAMKLGAVEFLTKPFQDKEMLDAITLALGRDRMRRARLATLDAMSRMLETLTKREAEVMWLVVDGLANKQIAFEMGITEVTVKLHRGKVMQKMMASSLADLVKKAGILRESQAATASLSETGHGVSMPG